MTAEKMRPRERFEWINRRAGPWAALLLLFCVGILAHRIAVVRVELIGDLSEKMRPTAAARLELVEYVNSQPWVAFPYLVIFAGGLLWTQFRKLPRWSLSVTFLLLALPLFGYAWICFRIVSTTGFMFYSVINKP